MKQSQKNWILEYISTYGSVTPAEMGGKHWNGRVWPSQGDKRCREMRTAGLLSSVEDPKTGYTEFFKKKEITYEMVTGVTDYQRGLFQTDQASYGRI